MLRKLKENFFSFFQSSGSSTESPYPQVHDTAWVAPDAIIIGDVEIGENSSVWPGAVIRGDIGKVEIGKNVNIQDNAVIHPSSKEGIRIGDNVTVAHGTVLDGCDVEDNVMIGINVTALHHSKIKHGSIIGAGSLLTPGTETEPESVYNGSPAEKTRDLQEQDRKIMEKMSRSYVKLKGEYE
ncbi:MAG: gamma carbonic anhydrase family protein [Candidatus Aenigmatarchaeota archaeon]